MSLRRLCVSRCELLAAVRVCRSVSPTGVQDVSLRCAGLFGVRYVGLSFFALVPTAQVGACKYQHVPPSGVGGLGNLGITATGTGEHEQGLW